MKSNVNTGGESFTVFLYEKYSKLVEPWLVEQIFLLRKITVKLVEPCLAVALAARLGEQARLV